MILLLSVSLLGQAGVKRLHPTLRRIRRHEQRSGLFALINRQDLSFCFAFTVLPFLTSPGLTSKQMSTRGILNPRPRATTRSVRCALRVRHCFSRNSRRNTGSWKPSPVAKNKPLVSVRASHAPWSSRVRYQPQQPVVQALKKI
jgi:hypothetical protein